MGFFPYLAPLSPWIKQVMEDREANPELSILRKNPFAILTSPALVVKGDSKVFSSDFGQRKDAVIGLINNPPSNAYKGCIIANNIDNLSLSYSTGKTPVGIDFDGKIIEVDNENGRRASTPIIETIDIDTDGANNTLKTAKVHVRCFTLKQLEMFEMFFMKPGMNVLLEFGDSTLKYVQNFNKKAEPGQPVTNDGKIYEIYQDGSKKPISVVKRVEEKLVEKVDYNTFCSSSFYKYFRSDRTGQIDYIQRVESTLGSYDLVAGKITNYNFSFDTNGTYMVELEISQGNQLTLATAHSTPKSKGREKTNPKNTEFSTYEQIVELMCADFNVDKDIFTSLLSKYPPNHENGGKWSVDWFNFIKVNKEQQDTVASSNAYVSLRFIFKILMNYILGEKDCDEEFFKFSIPKYTVIDTKKEVEIIPVQSHKSIISSSDQVIYPRYNIPQIIAPTKSKKGDKEKKLDENNEEQLVLNSKDVKDGRIGEGKDRLDFHYDKDIERTLDGKIQSIYKDFKEPKGNLVLGNALNIFVKYETVVKTWRSTYTRMDFLEKILNVVNQNSYGLFNLIFGVENENGKPTVIDHRFAPQKIIQQTEVDSYRFKPTTIKSIVRDFSFNFEMSNLVAGRTIFNSGKFLALAKKQASPSASLATLELPPQAYKSIDNSTFGNADGWYSINNVELKRIEANFQRAKEAEEKKSTVKTEDQKTDETTNEAEKLGDVVKSKSINFIINEDNPKGKKVVLIYKDPTFIRKKINTEEFSKNKPTVSPITVTITLDGFSGFRCGQYFNIDGIPEIYNQIGVFQITNTKHNVSKDGWTTTVEAEHRIITKK